MSGKTGQRATGRKPATVRRESDKADGAFGEQKPERTRTIPATRNVDKATRKRVEK